MRTKKNELINLIKSYLKSKTTAEDLYNYSWETIIFFAKHKEELPPYQDDEKTFWYAIWQLQHLSDKEHEADRSLARALIDIVAYLKNQKPLPEHFEGKRP